MSDLELTEAFFAKIAGWQAMKHARSLVERDQVLSADWSPPVLKGIAQEGSLSYRAGLVIKGERDLENLCTCRASREWGTICAHSVAVGLQYLKQSKATAGPAPVANAKPPSSSQPASLTAKSVDQRWWRTEGTAAAEPAELFVILPPNLPMAIARKKIMVCFEVGWRGGRTPLNALPKSEAFAVSPQDAAILDHLVALAGGDTPAALMIEAKVFASLLPILVGHPRVTLGKSVAITVSNTPPLLRFKASLQSNGEIVLALVDNLPASLAILEGEWIFHDDTWQPLDVVSLGGDMLRGPLRLSRAQVPQLLLHGWPRLQARGSVEADFRLDDFALEPQAPRCMLHLAGGLAQLQAQLQFAYGSHHVNASATSSEEELWLPDPGSATRYTTRDLNAERAALGRLLRAGFTGPDAQGRYALLGQNQVLNFFARDFARLEREWQVTLEERLEHSAAQHLERIEPQFQITSSGMQWFNLSVAFDLPGGERFSPADIQRLILSGQGYQRLRNGKFAVIDTGAVEELQEVLRDCAPQQHTQGYRLSSAQAGFLEATLRQQGWQAQAPPAWRERALRQSGEAKLECPPLGELENVLRPYQKAGVAWLHFLRANGFGGILADEMGLGKTLQALAFVQGRTGVPPVSNEKDAITTGNTGTEPDRIPVASDRRDAGPTLVVCPTSLVFNWVAEAQKFTPRLKVLALQGPDRQTRFPQIPQSDLVVTSYALIRRDAERYLGFEFDTVVLDEAQHIKNRQTQNAQAVKGLRARHRLVLTGTPLENSVLDLWSIFDFLMPGYLGAAQEFRERYELPITRDKSVALQERLARRLRPFVLRRTKREVAPELPPKLEQVAFCELTDDQRAVYQQVMDASRRELLEAVGAQGLARSRMVVLNALLRLRQICCDLRLLKLEGVDPATASGKMELFGELLEEALDGGHRVLVFSQFVSLLTLLRERLTAEGVEYCYLDGSTPDRGAVVDRFQRSAEIPVFLISLKAGGVGLNLTGADTVIHFDPWWNPAVEDQATDRAHRLGQSRVVTSYKLITRDTVEEKILTLQARKREVIQATLGSEEQLAEALTWDEIQELLA